MLLDEWYVEYELKKIDESGPIIMQVFCSFLDRNSLEFVFKLIQSDFLAENLSKYEILEEPLIIFVFFPVSTSFYVNSLFESYFDEFCILKSDLHKEQINEILEKAHDVIQKRYMQYKTYRIQDNEYSNLPKQEKYKIDKFLFGDLAAKYLDCIKQFPFILVKDRMYEGLPLNFSLNSFLNNIIFKELELISTKIGDRKPTERFELSII